MISYIINLTCWGPMAGFFFNKIHPSPPDEIPVIGSFWDFDMSFWVFDEHFTLFLLEFLHFCNEILDIFVISVKHRCKFQLWSMNWYIFWLKVAGFKQIWYEFFVIWYEFWRLIWVFPIFGDMSFCDFVQKKSLPLFGNDNPKGFFTSFVVAHRNGH